jgi:hypothetical protein
MVETEILNLALGILNFTVNLTCGKIDKTCGEVSEQHFKPQLLAYFR